jgi:hypothetical protein
VLDGKDRIMTSESLEPRWKSYMDAYAAISAAERERLLRQSVAEDVVFSNPTGEEGHGIAKLVAHVSQFQKMNPGGYFRTNKLLTHHGQLLSEWTMCKEDGTEVVTAHTYARFDEHGRLTHTAGFWKV